MNKKTRKDPRTGAANNGAGTGMKYVGRTVQRPSHRLMEAFNNSLAFDKALIEEDIEGSIAWAAALARAGRAYRERGCGD